MPAVNGTMETSVEETPGAAAPPKAGKKTSVEQVYQKKTQLEHILLRPDSYIGSVEPVTESTWIYDAEQQKIIQKEITFVPGLYKIFDEILVNAADNKQRDPSMDTIKVDIDQTNNTISVWNNGKGIPVAMHKDEKMYVPTMIFGHLLTSSNYDDTEKKVTGGRNGYGAKLCNIFSTKFTVETAAGDYKKSFKQTWGANMSKASEPKVKESDKSNDFTKVTFSPDLPKFKMEKLEDDTVALFSRRAYDIAASTRGVKVFLNGKRVPVKNFKEYVDLFIKGKEDDVGQQIKCVYEQANERWEVAITQSDKGFQQMSFVNSIATTKGGRHIDYVTDMIVKNLIETLKKKNKSGITIKPFQIKNHMWIFVNALIVNPTFDSQTKENMTLQSKSFGSKLTLTDKFYQNTAKSGIVESVMAWAKFKQQAQLQSKCQAKKTTKLKGIPKLEDANDAGTRHSSDCTLILTEGDSAKTLAVAGLGVVGRDRYGVFPLKGKLLNVREATHKQILENAEINNLIKILGLQYKKKYESQEDIKTLRYGKLMIMTDQDQDGSHIKGLLINFIHHNWPSLIQQRFLEEFITPIVKASKGKQSLSFFSLPEFEEWKRENEGWNKWKIKYYKGLGTSTSIEAKEYFGDMLRHRVLFGYGGQQDDHSITMAFSRKAIEQRKEWLTRWMEECKRRKELGLPEIYLYEKDTRQVNYTDFVNKELILFSNMDNERSIPCLVDGFKPGQRKVIFTCLKRNDKREVKVAQLSGSVAEHSAYHHGEMSLQGTIIGLAQNFVGSNNINLLLPIGQFGTRLQGGHDKASPRYIFTQLNPVTRTLFHPHDDDILKFQYDDGQRIEPEWYCPIIPMVLVNGADGIGTGWSTKVQNYNPRDIVANIRRMIKGDEPEMMNPWFKNFRGTIENIDGNRFANSGEIGRLAHNKYEISELPVRCWTQQYKESVMEPLLTGSEKVPSLISDYKEYHTDTTVRFVVTIPEAKVGEVEDKGLHNVFKLQETFSTTNMVMFDDKGCLRKFDSVMHILKEFYEVRLKMYEKRKKYLLGLLGADAGKLSNQARFILEKCDGKLVIENKKKKDIVAELVKKGYDPDPVKTWTRVVNREKALEEEREEMEAEGEEEDEGAEPGDEKASDFDYLMSMAMWNLTKEKKDALLKKRDEKLQEVERLKRKSEKDLWEDDLKEFLAALDKQEQKERDDESGNANKLKGAKGGPKGRKKTAEETLPDPTAERVAPTVDPALRLKVEKAAAAKENKGKRVKKEKGVKKEATDEFDDIVSSNTGKSLADRLGNSPDAIAKKAKNEKKMKQSTLNFKKGSPKKKSGKNPWETDSEEEIDSDASDMSVEVAPRERAAGGRRAAAAKIKYSQSGSDESDSDMSLHSNDGVDEPSMHQGEISVLDDSVMSVKKEEVDIGDTDSEFEEAPKPKKPKAPKAAPKPKASPPKPSADDLFASAFGASPGSDSAPAPAPKAAKPKKEKAPKEDKPKKEKKAPAKKKPAGSDSEDDKPKKKAAPKKAAKKRSYSDSSDEDMFDPKPKGKAKSAKTDEDSFALDDSPVAPRPKTGRARAPAKTYTFDDDSEEDSDF